MTVWSGPASQLGKIWTLRGTRIDGPELAAATMAKVATRSVPIAIRPATGPSVTREPASSGSATRGRATGRLGAGERAGGRGKRNRRLGGAWVLAHALKIVP